MAVFSGLWFFWFLDWFALHWRAFCFLLGRLLLSVTTTTTAAMADNNEFPYTCASDSAYVCDSQSNGSGMVVVVSSSLIALCCLRTV